MLLDEPVRRHRSDLDLRHSRSWLQALKKREIGVLITDHNVRETLELVDRACIIYDGQVLFAGSPEALSPIPTCAASISARASSFSDGTGPRLELRQSQSLVMTPPAQQAIRLLALSNLEIEGFIAEEIEKNPLLDSGGKR
jgi:ABC-type multidrug transport system ATPase subunit